MLSPTITVAGV